ncbi:exopolyphosphatase [Aliamphritea spongicola]|uniref:exopolyphosphatase n=1 Tax=Aliamphritea spongicola TaxID=707589 RepID=UPI00196B5FAD|nr:exopolyphosphatase [Aliamphritea spongicola]MBN3564629.1 exopolyphosphatase [Aliamphritea spongicola]
MPQDNALVASQDTLMAAIDLGSNSFHIVIAKLDQGELLPIDVLSEKVQLAAGLDDNNILSDEAQQRGLECLQRFAERIKGLPSGSVSAVATNALREAVNSQDFIVKAESVLGRPIEVIAGIEEARLIHLGVEHTLAAESGSRLIIDIGGGSTEFIIGERFEPLELESLEMGCVSFSKRYFKDGIISEKNFQLAVFGALRELLAIKRRYKRQGWQYCVGSSGTVKAIQQACIESGFSESAITAKALKNLRERILEFSHSDEICIPGIKDQRKAVIAAGVAILSAAFESLGIKEMHYSAGALREGLLYDMTGRLHHEDVRERSINALMNRYHVDQEHALRVEQTALIALTQVRNDWKLQDTEYQNMLSWAARSYETGLTIAHSQYHKHSAYLVLNSDLPGFSQQEQLQLATLIRNHRRKFNDAEFSLLPKREISATRKLCVLLRIAIVLHRSRSKERLPAFTITVSENTVSLSFPDNWLSYHPLTRADLEQEAAYLATAGTLLNIS